MLDGLAFKAVMQKTPLVSIDLCLVCAGQIFLGRRPKEPLRVVWIAPIKIMSSYKEMNILVE
jgi:hypothetical protein